ncbi:MAG TPA: ABC transporter permease [Gemmatimonadales bacterium]|nr:ABC transporter permease [Gemmatimonadales bacterium]
MLTTLVVALGTGGITALASVVDVAFLLPPPGLPSDQRLEWVYPMTGGEANTISFPDYLDLQRSVPNLLAYRWYALSDGSASSRRLGVSLISSNYFKVLGIRPSAGVLFGSAEEDPGELRSICVVSARFAANTFGAPSAAIGQRLTLNRHQFTIVGIGPSGFRGMNLTSPTDVWLPVEAIDLILPSAPGTISRRGDAQFAMIASAPNAAAAAALDAELASRWATIQQDHPDTHTSSQPLATVGMHAAIEPMAYRWFQGILFRIGVVLSLVAIAASGALYSLTAAHWARREQEMAIKRALGASRGLVMWEAVTEGLPRAFAGAWLAYLVGTVLLRVILASWATELSLGLPEAVKGKFFASITLPFALVIACTLLVIWNLSAVPIRRAIVEGGGASTSGPAARRRQAVGLAMQVVCAILLLAVLIDSVNAARSARTALLATAHRLPIFVAALSVDELASATNATVATAAPAQTRLSTLCYGHCTYSSSVPIIGRPSRAFVHAPDGKDSVLSWIVTIGPAFVHHTAAVLQQGRDIGPSDLLNGSNNALISSSLATALGRRTTLLESSIKIGGTGSGFNVVGIISDIPYASAGGSEATEAMFVPYDSLSLISGTAFIMAGDSVGLDRVARAIGPNRTGPPPTTESLGGLAIESLQEERLALEAMFASSLLTFVIVLLGIYGTCRLFVATRTHDLGIMAALGASRYRLYWQTIRPIVRVLLGGTIGAMGVSVAASLLSTPDDRIGSLLSFGAGAFCLAVSLVVFGSGVAAIPAARQAAAADPASALRL